MLCLTSTVKGFVHPEERSDPTKTPLVAAPTPTNVLDMHPERKKVQNKEKRIFLKILNIPK